MKKGINYLTFIARYEIIIASAAVLLLIFFLAANILVPNLYRAREITTQEQALKKRSDILAKKNTVLASLDYEYYKAVFLKLNQVLPEAKDYVSLIGTFDTLEKQSGVSVVKTDFQLGSVSTTSSSLVRAGGTAAFIVPLHVEVMGSLETVEKFLEAVANYTGRLMVFDEMSVSVQPQGILDVSFTGRAFFYPLPTTLGAIDTSLPEVGKDQENILAKVNKLPLPASEAKVELDKNSVGKKNLFE